MMKEVLCVAAIPLTQHSCWHDNLTEVTRLIDLAVSDGCAFGCVTWRMVFLFYGKGMR